MEGFDRAAEHAALGVRPDQRRLVAGGELSVERRSAVRGGDSANHAAGRGEEGVANAVLEELEQRADLGLRLVGAVATRRKQAGLDRSACSGIGLRGAQADGLGDLGVAPVAARAGGQLQRNEQT